MEAVRSFDHKAIGIQPSAITLVAEWKMSADRGDGCACLYIMMRTTLVRPGSHRISSHAEGSYRAAGFGQP